MKQKPTEKSMPFSARHPKLNFLLGLLLLLFLAAILEAIICWFLQATKSSITVAAEWLASLASKLDAVIIVALITGCVSIVGVLISSIIAKRIDYKRSRQEYLAKKREEPYGQFVDMVYKIQQNSKKQTVIQRHKCWQTCLCFQSRLLYGGPQK